MRWVNFKKMLAEHPYFMSDDFKMSLDQACEIQNKEGYPTFEEMVAMAKRKSQLPVTAWAPVDAVIAKRRPNTSDRKNIWKKPLGRWVVAAFLYFAIGLLFGVYPIWLGAGGIHCQDDSECI